MKVFCSLLLVAIVVYTCDASAGDILDKYDLVTMAKDDQKLQRVMECLALEKPCDNLQDLKDDGTTVLTTNCGDCTPGQKEKFEKFLIYMKENRQKEMEAITKSVLEGNLKQSS